MAIVIVSFSVITRKSTVEEKYPGGLIAYERDCPNWTYCSDAYLCSVGFMVKDDADRFIWTLAASGFIPYRDGKAEDIVIATPYDGPLLDCPWLDHGQHDGQMVVRLSGTEIGVTVCPPWMAEFSTHPIPLSDLEFVNHQGPVEVYKHKTTGKTLYVGRTQLTSEKEQTQERELYTDALRLIRSINSDDSASLNQDQLDSLEKAIHLLNSVVRTSPSNWEAMFSLGKAYEALGEKHCQLRFDWFSRAYRVNPDHPDLAREAGIAAMVAGRPEEAEVFCRRAVELKPDDPGLRANLALSLLFLRKLDEAQFEARDALRQNPADEITKDICGIIDEVMSGLRPSPHHIRDLE
jgi:hypothetical protein